jgi:hypothetical protein
MLRITSKLAEIAKSEQFREAYEKMMNSEKEFDKFVLVQLKNKKLKKLKK